MANKQALSQAAPENEQLPPPSSARQQTHATTNSTPRDYLSSNVQPYSSSQQAVIDPSTGIPTPPTTLSEEIEQSMRDFEQQIKRLDDMFDYGFEEKDFTALPDIGGNTRNDARLKKTESDQRQTEHLNDVLFEFDLEEKESITVSGSAKILGQGAGSKKTGSDIELSKKS